MTEDQRNLRKKRLDSVPEGGEFVGFRRVQRQHGVVVDAGFLDVRKMWQEQTEVHDISPSVWLKAIL
jgi:hypothetical protein